VTSYRCDGCGATLQSVEELDRQVGTATRSWFCTYCGVSVPSRVAERIQHREDGGATDRRS
jgi:DNA-directed RNA polymerase subunit RPC12/RpoP